MTSKECLERIIFVAKLDKPIFSVYYQELIEAKEKIEKDLEILDILKKYVYFSSKSNCVRMKDIYKRTTNFDYETLKEWLENGK